MNFPNSHTGKISKKSTNCFRIRRDLRKDEEKLLKKLGGSPKDVLKAERITNVIMVIGYGDPDFAIKEMTELGPNLLARCFNMHSVLEIQGVFCRIPFTKNLNFDCNFKPTTNEDFSEEHISPIGMAIVKKNEKVLEWLLSDPKLDPDYICTGSHHPLTLCAIEGDFFMFKRLFALESCKNKNPVVSVSQEADLRLLDYCIHEKLTAFVKVLKEAGFVPRAVEEAEKEKK
jgi:hypothetical protein